MVLVDVHCVSIQRPKVEYSNIDELSQRLLRHAGPGPAISAYGLSFGDSACVEAFVEHILGELQQTTLLANAKRVRNPNGLFANLRDDLRLR
jgi:hypothetical protein